MMYMGVEPAWSAPLPKPLSNQSPNQNGTDTPAPCPKNPAPCPKNGKRLPNFRKKGVSKDVKGGTMPEWKDVKGGTMRENPICIGLDAIRKPNPPAAAGQDCSARA